MTMDRARLARMLALMPYVHANVLRSHGGGEWTYAVWAER